MRHLALRDSVLIAFQAATDGRLIGGCHAGDYLQLPRFIIGVLITTGFAKISAIFINSETEAILPTDTGYWECDRSWIKSWIGEYCKNSRSSLDVRSDLIDLLRVVLGSVPRGYLQYLPQLLQNLILPNKNSAKLLIGLAGLFVMNNFQSTVPSHKLIIILLDLIANMKPHTFPPERAAAKKRKLLLAAAIIFCACQGPLLGVMAPSGQFIEFCEVFGGVAICKLNRKMRGERGRFYVQPLFAGI